MRKAIAYVMVVAGLTLMVMSYFYLAAPWGFPPAGEEYSNPDIPFTPGFFILGFLIVFLAPVVYEVLPERRRS